MTVPKNRSFAFVHFAEAESAASELELLQGAVVPELAGGEPDRGAGGEPDRGAGGEPGRVAGVGRWGCWRCFRVLWLLNLQVGNQTGSQVLGRGDAKGASGCFRVLWLLNLEVCSRMAPAGLVYVCDTHRGGRAGG